MRNTVTIVGNLVADPERRETPSGMVVCNARIAHNHTADRASFVDVVAWGETAERLVAGARKGSRILVLGHLEENRWETSEGEKRSRIEVVAETIGLTL